MIQRALSFWPVIMFIGAAIFGYGVLNQRVAALEKQDVTTERKIDTIDNNVKTILNDVSFIKGQLSHK